MVTVVPGGIPNSGQHGALFSPWFSEPQLPIWLIPASCLYWSQRDFSHHVSPHASPTFIMFIYHIHPGPHCPSENLGAHILIHKWPSCVSLGLHLGAWPQNTMESAVWVCIELSKEACSFGSFHMVYSPTGSALLWTLLYLTDLRLQKNTSAPSIPDFRKPFRRACSACPSDPGCGSNVSSGQDVGLRLAMVWVSFSRRLQCLRGDILWGFQLKVAQEWDWEGGLSTSYPALSQHPGRQSDHRLPHLTELKRWWDNHSGGGPGRGTDVRKIWSLVECPTSAGSRDKPLTY